MALSALQIAFISGLPGWFSSLNLILVVLIFILGFVGFEAAMWWSLGTGLLLEIFSFLPFGIYLISFCLTMAIANFLLNYFFTNRSLYSFLALTALSTLAYELLVNLAAFFFLEAGGRFFLMRSSFWSLVLEQIILNLLFTIFLYYVVHFFSRNFRPEFLIKNKKY